MRKRPIIWGVVLTALWCADAHADYVETYNQAMRAYRAEQWRLAADLMRQARSERASETGRVRFTGNATEPYVPSYYLGDALMRLGDCPGALEAFAIAERTQAAGNRSWTTRIANVRTTCGASDRAKADAAFAQAIGQAEPVLQRARAAQAQLRDLRNESYGPEALQAFVAEQNQAAADLAQAEARVGEARKASNSRAASEGQRLAQGALTRFEDVHQRVRTEIQRLDGAAKERAAATAKAAEATAREAKLAEAREQALRELLGQTQGGVRLAQEAMTAYREAAGARPVPPGIVDAQTVLAAADKIVRRGTAAGEAELKNAGTLAARARDTFVRERETVLAGDADSLARAIARAIAGGRQSLGVIEQLAGRGGAAALNPAEQSRVAEDRKALDRVSASLAAAGRPASASDRAVAENAARRLASLADALRKRTTADSGVPPGLVAAARALFTGNYADARAQLDRLPETANASSALRFQTQLLRAAALYGAWAVGGEQDDALNRAAAEAVANCKRLAPAARPDPAVFSPRFVAFYAARSL